MIWLVPFHLGSHTALLPPIAERLGAVFATRVETHPPVFDPETAFQKSRGQYNSRAVLEMLLAEEADGRVVGVTAVDLFIPVLSYVFGEAQLGGRASVLSVYRLRPEAYGLPQDARLLRLRAVKEALHELGHSYGLVHCQQTDCVMRSSTYVEDIDLKPDRFCERCLGIIRG